MSGSFIILLITPTDVDSCDNRKEYLTTKSPCEIEMFTKAI